MVADEVITGVCVCWNTKELVERSYSSLRQFHPSIKIILIDGSFPSMECYRYLDSILDENLQVIHVGYNIGHGKGMCRGIQKSQTPFVLLFDSDIIMVKSPVQAMLDMMEDDTYGVGYIEIVAPDGHDYGVLPRHKGQPQIKYMHPYFQLIQVKEYKKYTPFIHHGAPCISTMCDIHKRKLSNKVLKEFPGLGHTNGQGISWSPCSGEYIKHDVAGFGGTGKMRVQSGLPHIEGTWEKVI